MTRSVQSVSIRRHGAHFFTMVEMLVVIAIITIILAIAVPTFDRLAVGTGVDAAQRMVAGKVHLLRHYAISKRSRVALVMPADNPEIGGNYRYACMRPAVVSGNTSPFTFVQWVDSTAWDFLPVGSTISEADNDLGIDGGAANTPTDNGISTVAIPKDDLKQLGTSGAATINVRALVLSPTARVLGDTRYLTVSDTTYAPDGTWIVRDNSSNNEFTICVNPYTARPVVQGRSEY